MEQNIPEVNNIEITPQMLSQIAEIDEFKGAWTGLARLRPEQLKALKKVSTIESIGSSNRIEGNKLSDEEEVAGYAGLWLRPGI